ncbi:MAG: type II toxin-antitoxin system RelE/ParE family toxin [Pyramidobacter sp.]|nr:type II toxin-antitoxin system RelE/ParE family toxin [Pyramidobacter sp.]
MSRIFKTDFFMRKTKKMEIDDALLARAVEEMRTGLIDADLGGNVYKKRVPLSGHGKSGGARTIVATCKGGHWFFLYAYAKNVRENITDNELAAFRETASMFLALTDEQLDYLCKDGTLLEVSKNERDH